ncbi:MAG TPA: NAD(+) synthase [Candidatus Blautia stercoravium]|nr:NAD(+) synthase [Candidatus Blautia stercoravium]
MKDGFIKVAAATPDIQVADCVHNTREIVKKAKEMSREGARILVFPELCITGYTCQDLFQQDTLLESAKEQLLKAAEELKEVPGLIFVGLPLEFHGKLYNTAAVLNGGEILGIVPKQYLPNYGEFYEARHFVSGGEILDYIPMGKGKVPFGSRLLFTCEEMPGLTVAAEICEDLWAPCPPSVGHAMAGANVVVNLSASDETVGKTEYRRSLVKGQSARLLCGYIYAAAGSGESTQDLVFGGQNLICENGSLLAEAPLFTNDTIYGILDIQKLRGERRRISTWQQEMDGSYLKIPFHLPKAETLLTNCFEQNPFVPGNLEKRAERCNEILNIQAMGLRKRMEHTHCKTAVLGISGGLDSTLALLVTARAMDLLGMDRKQIVAVTMPCFGTTDRTYTNACELTRRLGAELLEVDIKKAVLQHFEDIGQDPQVHDVTFENAQARERTQVIMDIANQRGGMVIGTGDLSELALGWATYNGDHMSMYGVNGSVPKTLVRYLVRYYAETCGEEKLAQILMDVLDTPVSPELLPPEDGVISQKTEDLVGPYELHDFFLYYMLRFHFSPSKIYRMAKVTFEGTYDGETILKWLKKFYWRFFSQQFKRSCLPDGPKVGSVAVSPRGDLRMPSDACVTVWMNEIEKL